MSDSIKPWESQSPSAYREQNPYKPPPPEYKPPSVLAEHKGLAIVFAVILIGFVVYGWRTLHAPRRRPPYQRAATAAAPADTTPHASGSNQPPPPDAASAAQPIYIEALPEKQPP